MAEAPIIFSVDDAGVALMTLNRPDAGNAFTVEMLDEWANIIDRSSADSNIGALLVTGAGDRVFCAGADLSQGRLGTATDIADDDLRRTVHRIPRALQQFDKPYIAVVNGAAVGAGMDMASMADLRFVSETAWFAMSYVRVGVIPGAGGAYLLPQLVGRQRALHLIWTGEKFDAREAVEWGYAHSCHKREELLGAATDYARQLCAGPRLAHQMAKRLVRRSLETGFDAALDLAQDALTRVRLTEDAKEGPRAFKEKRNPRFVGR